jgi:GNAT superfamily N-acetyltransferase
MKTIRSGSALIVALLFAAWSPARAGITWDWHYVNPEQIPAGAKQALTNVGYTLDRWFQIPHNVTVTIRIKGFSKAKGSLGSASSESVSDAAGFHRTVLMQHILSGTDPNPDGADGSVNINFTPDYRWAYGSDVPQTQMDFTSTMLHELLHCLGFAGDISPSYASNGTVSWTVFDKFITDAQGGAMIYPAGSGTNSYRFDHAYLDDLVGNPGMYFSGAKAMQANGNKRVAIYSPNPWSDGSSGSHPDTSFAPSLMQFDGGGGGLESRTLHKVEAGIMQDIGYTLKANAEFGAPRQQARERSRRDPATGRRAVATNFVPIRIIRHGDISATGSVDYVTLADSGKGWAAEGQDYLAASGTLHFAAGVATGAFDLAVLANTNAESTVESVRVILANPRGVILGALTNVTLRIVDEEKGLRQTVLLEDFNAGVLPRGWSVRNFGEAAGWVFNNPSGRSNLTGGAGGFVLADSETAGESDLETELTTPALDLGVFDYVVLRFNLDYAYAPNLEDYLAVELSTNGPAGPWEPVWDAPNESYPMPTFANEADLTNAVITPIRTGNFRGPRTVELDLTEEAAGCSNVLIRFAYRDARAAGWAALDNVRVYGVVDYEAADEDTHGIGLPDWWLDRYFDNPASVTAAGDPDEDGFSNLQEFLAGTDPTDRESRPEIEAVEAEDRSQVALFFGEPGRAYTLAFSNRFTAGWVPVNAQPVSGQGDYLALTNANSRNNAYRLEVRLPGREGAVTSAVVSILGLPVPLDFDADRYPDLAVFDPDGAGWYARRTSDQALAARTWGWPGAWPLAGDYDGDGAADLAVYDPNRGLWYAAALDGRMIGWAIPWGFAGALPVPADYDGDGATELAVFDPASGAWYVRTLAGDLLGWAEPWGWPGALPVPADYDGDRRADLAVYDRAAGLWYIRRLTGALITWAFPWGFEGAVPAPGDYNGDGAADPAVYDPPSGAWYVRSLEGSVLDWARPWGFEGVMAVPGDFDGDEIADFALYHPPTGAWYMLSPVRGVLAFGEPWGWDRAVPVAPQVLLDRLLP